MAGARADPGFRGRIGLSGLQPIFRGFGRRLGKGHCTVGGKTLNLGLNNGPHHRHGGFQGFNLRHWQAKVIEGTLTSPDQGSQPAAGVRFSLTSPDGDQGFPGKVLARVDIVITEDNQLVFAYQATTGAETPLNLTNHAYWNLQGEGSGTIHDHVLRLASPGWLEVDDGSIPTGKFCAMAGSAWDFSAARKMETVLSPRNAPADSPKIGIDHNFIVDPKVAKNEFRLEADGTSQSAPVRLAAELAAPGSIGMSVLTSLPGVQVYTANYLNGENGRKGPHPRHAGICLETQNFPDAPNQAEAFRVIGKRLGYGEADMAGWDGLLRPGTTWNELTVHRFQ